MMKWLRSNVLLILLTVGTLFTFLWLKKNSKVFLLNRHKALSIAVLHTLYGVFCVKVFAFAEAGFNSDAIGNMSLFGGIFFMPMFYFLIAKALKIRVDIVFDYCTICMVFTVMCARINCIFAGCCYGLHIFNSQLRWPTRETEIIFYIILMIWIVEQLKKGDTNGIIYPVYMMSYGIFRFIIEFFRFYRVGAVLHPAHIWSILSFCIGCSIYIQIKSKKKEKGDLQNE